MTIRKFLVFAVLLLCSALLLNAAAVPAGTVVTVRSGSELSSGTARTGQTWEGSLAKDVVVNGQTVARDGDRVTGKVTNAKSSGRLHAPGLLTLRLTAINGEPVSSTAYGRKGKSHTKSNVTKIGGGAAAGALIGALAGGGKGAAIGTPAGGAARPGVAAYTRKPGTLTPPRNVLHFTLHS